MENSIMKNNHWPKHRAVLSKKEKKIHNDTCFLFQGKTHRPIFLFLVTHFGISIIDITSAQIFVIKQVVEVIVEISMDSFLIGS